MKYVRYSLLLVLLFTFPEFSHPQDAVRDYDQAFGLDQTLCNGKKYYFIVPAGTRGDPFLVSPLYISGSVTLKGRCYRHVILNYDIYNQQILLQYADTKGVMLTIEVSKAWLDGFTLGSRTFERLKSEQQEAYYQVLGSGPVRVAYYWHKTLNLNEAIGSSNYQFSKAIRDSFVLFGGKTIQFKTRKGFIEIFDPSIRPQVKNYIRKNRIRLKRASDNAMADLINYVGKIWNP